MGSDNNRWLSHVPAGWHAIFRQMVEELAEFDPDLEVDDAKQKFGELRVSLKGGSIFAYEIVDRATDASREACEQCGAKGRLRKNRHGWYRTLCADHAQGFMPAVGSPMVASVRLFLPRDEP